MSCKVFLIFDKSFLARINLKFLTMKDDVTDYCRCTVVIRELKPKFKFPTKIDFFFSNISNQIMI